LLPWIAVVVVELVVATMVITSLASDVSQGVTAALVIAGLTMTSVIVTELTARAGHAAGAAETVVATMSSFAMTTPVIASAASEPAAKTQVAYLVSATHSSLSARAHEGATAYVLNSPS
jgi:hypothetical protein